MSRQMKIGCDIVSLTRFRKVLSRTKSLSKRLFLPQEEKGASLEKLAGIFAAKESTMKALGIRAGRWQEIEVSFEKNGKPRLKLERSLNKKFTAYDLSIAHDGDYVISFVCFI